MQQELLDRHWLHEDPALRERTVHRQQVSRAVICLLVNTDAVLLVVHQFFFRPAHVGSLLLGLYARAFALCLGE